VCKSPVATQTITKLSGCSGSRHQAIVNANCHKMLAGFDACSHYVPGIVLSDFQDLIST